MVWKLDLERGRGKGEGGRGKGVYDDWLANSVLLLCYVQAAVLGPGDRTSIAYSYYYRHCYFILSNPGVLS